MNAGTVLSEGDIEGFINKLKQVDTDKKVDQIQLFGLKLEDASELPIDTLDALTLTISPLLRAPSHLLVTSILNSFLPFYLPLIPSTPSSSSQFQVALHQILPVLLDKLNDPKDRIHIAASTCIAILGRKCYEAEPAVGASTMGNANAAPKGKEKEGLVGYWERFVKETMGGKAKRGKVEAMKILLVLRNEEKSRLPLKPWLGVLVELLEHGDGNVRDQARETVVALLSPQSTPSAARSELKKLLTLRNVRKTIADGIITRIFAGGTSTAISGRSTPALENHTPLEDKSIGGIGRSEAPTPANDDVEIVYVASGRDLENEFATMAPYFEGKETEHNWLPREKSAVRIRGMLRGQAYQQYPESFMIGLKAGTVKGLSKTLTSLRTTVAQQSCAVMQELPEYLGSAFDPFVEGLLPVLAKMAGYTKKIIAEKSQRVVGALIIHTTCHPRVYISHINSGTGEKNPQIRQYSTAHLKTFLDNQAVRSRHAIETTPGALDMFDTSVKKGLSDVTPTVRELGRAAYWSYNNVWPAKAKVIIEGLDGVARKQLENANPNENGVTTTTVQPTRPSMPKTPQASSAMSQLLAEKRKAKAAELAAGRASGQESPRSVSSPAPASPTLPQGMPRSLSSQPVPAVKKTTPLARTMTSPQTSPRSPAAFGSPSPPSRTTSNLKPQANSPSSLFKHSRSSSLGRTYSTSPPSSRGSPILSKSPLRQAETVSSGLRSPGSSSSASGGQHLGTPTFARAPLPDFSRESNVGLGIEPSESPPSTNLIDLTSRSNRAGANTDGTRSGPVSDAFRAQADQGLSAAQQLLDFDDGGDVPARSPWTPARHGPVNGSSGPSHLLKTPVTKIVNGVSSSSNRAPWEDSPRPEAMTPQMLTKLKERKHERSWWLKRQELLDKASPLKSGDHTRDPTSAIQNDIEGLESGSPQLRNLQKLALFAESHKIPGGGEEEDGRDAVGLWQEGRVFDRIFDGLMVFLDHTKPIDMLEQALVLLWAMVQHQWRLFEDRDMALADALFRLRASPNSVILESTNSLVSLLCEVSEPLFFLSVIHGALERYLSQHPSEHANGTGGHGGEHARASGYLFGLTAMGMCVLRLPREVVSIEGARLAPIVMEALASPTVTSRQAANTLILAMQAVLCDAQITLSLFPGLDDGQRNLATYLMEKNGLLRAGRSVDEDEDEQEGMERRDKVVGEMVGLLGRGTTRR